MDMIGTLLYTERRKKGLEIVDVEQATGIRGIYLQALEQGKYEALPGEVYVKGFIRNYGNFLGLDGGHLVHLYNEATAPATAAPVQAATTASQQPVVKKMDSLTKHSMGKKSISTMVVAFILALSVWGLYAWQKSQPIKSPVAKETSATVPKQATAGPTPVAPSTYPASTPPAGAAASVLPATSRAVVLVARYTDRCWTSVIADGKTLYEGIPKMNDTFTWEADRQIVVNFGNAAAVDLTFNGQPVGKVGGAGDVVVKTFTSPTALPTPTAPESSTALPATPPVSASPSAPGTRP